MDISDVDNFGICILDPPYDQLLKQYFLTAHLGGFLMGLLVGMVLYPIISETKRHKAIVWACRIAAIPIAIVLFVVLIRNFYTNDPYSGTS